MAEAEEAAAGASSPWLARHARRLREAARRGPVLDVACGRGRHLVTALALGARTVGLDRDGEALAAARRAAARAGPDAPARLLAVRTDVEAGLGMPVAPATCGAVLVFRFLFRPLAPALAGALRPGGLLLYETFTLPQRDLPYGPSNPAFLLAAGELPALFPQLEVLAYEEGWTGGPRPFAVARLAARRPG